MVEYGIIVFNPMKNEDIVLLEIAQNSFTGKLMMRLFSMNYDRIPHGSQRSFTVVLPLLRNTGCVESTKRRLRK